MPTVVHGGVPLHELPSGERLGSTGLEGEVGEVVGGEPKTLLCWVRPQHCHDHFVQEASDECLASCCPREDIRTGRLGEGTPRDGLCRPGVDEVEGAKAHGGPRV
jgi:hypothetical protein